MRSEVYSIEYVDSIIDYLENKIENNALTPVLLNTVQKWLDTIENTYRDSPTFSDYYSRLLELQALVYGESNQDDRALEYMKEAVRVTGSVGLLYSRLIKNYIMRRNQASMQQPVEAVNTAEDQTVSDEHENIMENQLYDNGYLDHARADESDVVDEPSDGYEPKHATEVHRRRHRFRKTKIALAVVFGLIVVGSALFKFVPQSSAVSMLVLKHDEITRAKNHFEALTAQYQECSSKLSGARNTVDVGSPNAVSSFNQEMADCQSILQQQDHAATVYNKLIGKN
jgi:hypothetical protein